MTATPADVYIKGLALPLLADGSVTSAQGFRAGALAAGIKASGKPDLGIWAADVECVAAATFTPNKFPAAPVGR